MLCTVRRVKIEKTKKTLLLLCVGKRDGGVDLVARIYNFPLWFGRSCRTASTSCRRSCATSTAWAEFISSATILSRKSWRVKAPAWSLIQVGHIAFVQRPPEVVSHGTDHTCAHATTRAPGNQPSRVQDGGPFVSVRLLTWRIRRKRFRLLH